MRISLNSPDLQGVARDSATSSAGAHPAHAATPESGDGFPEDRVTISSLALQAMQTPEIREGQVASLQQKVLNGQYELDPQAIADAMLSR